MIILADRILWSRFLGPIILCLVLTILKIIAIIYLFDTLFPNIFLSNNIILAEYFWDILISCTNFTWFFRYAILLIHEYQ